MQNDVRHISGRYGRQRRPYEKNTQPASTSGKRIGEKTHRAGGRVTNDRQTKSINKKARCDSTLRQKQTRKAGSSNAKAETQTRTRNVSDSTKKTALREPKNKARRENEKQERDGVDAAQGKQKPQRQDVRRHTTRRKATTMKSFAPAAPAGTTSPPPSPPAADAASSAPAAFAQVHLNPCVNL